MKTSTIEELSGRTGHLASSVVARLLRIGNLAFGGTIKPTITTLGNIEPNCGTGHSKCLGAPLSASTHPVTSKDGAGRHETKTTPPASDFKGVSHEPGAMQVASAAPAVPFDEVKPAEPRSTSLVPAASDDKNKGLKRDITKKYFDATLGRLCLFETKEPGTYKHSYLSVTVSVPDVSATRRSQLAYLRCRSAEWILEDGKEPEREYPYLSRNTAEARYLRRKEYWFVHWLQPTGYGISFRRSEQFVGVKEYPIKADALKLLDRLDDVSPSWVISGLTKPFLAKLRKME